jgi:plastocyanin
MRDRDANAKAGEYAYFCSRRRHMAGKVIVRG